MIEIDRSLHRLLFSPVFLCLAFIVVIGLNLGIPPLLDVDEGAFSEATREMVASGNYAATYLDGVPRYDKPILIYWFQALSVKLLGVNEWAFRLPSAIFSGLWLIALFSFARQFTGKYRAFIATFALMSCLLFGMVGRAAFADALLNLCLSLTLFDIYRYSQSPSRPLIYRVYLWMALGMLAKGPVAVAIPLLVSFIYFIHIKQTGLMIRAFFNPIGWIIFLAMLLPWLWLVYQDQGIGFFKGFFIDHNLSRFTATKEGHGGVWYYYLLVFPLIILPFSGGLFRPFTHYKTLFKKPLTAFLFIWLLVVIVIFSLSNTQLPHYVMNAATPFVLLFALLAHQYKVTQYYLLPSFIIILLMLFLPIIGQYYQGDAPDYVLEMLKGTTAAFSVTYYIAAIALLLSFIWITYKLKLPLWGKLVYAGLLQAIFVYYSLLPSLATLQQAPVKEAALIAKAADAKVVRYGITMPSFSVYREAITEKRLPKASEWVFTRAGQGDRLAKAIAPLSLETIYAKGGVRLFKVKE